MKTIANRIPSLDGLRTISITLVITGHLLHVLGYGDFGNLGNLGVRVFFVISGFLITGLLMKEIEKTSTVNLLKFYFRRTLRIFPPFYFYLLVLFLLTAFGATAISFKYLFFASAYLTDYVHPSNWYLGHTWSLAVEEQFYLIFPTVLLILGVKRTKVFLCFLVLAGPFIRLADFQIFGAENVWITKGFHANMDALAIGCLLALFYNRLHQNDFYLKLLKSKTVILFPVIILIANLQTDHPHIFLGASFSVMNILIAFCIDRAVTNYDSAVGKVLNSAPLVTLGMMSYSIYLWQQPFFNPDSQSLFTRMPFNFIGLTIMTLISYFLVEKYSLKLRQKLEKVLFEKKMIVDDSQTLNYQKTAS